MQTTKQPTQLNGWQNEGKEICARVSHIPQLVINTGSDSINCQNRLSK